MSAFALIAPQFSHVIACDKRKAFAQGSDANSDRLYPLVITGLVPVIHVLLSMETKDVDGRVKPGHDERPGAIIPA